MPLRKLFYVVPLYNLLRQVIESGRARLPPLMPLANRFLPILFLKGRLLQPIWPKKLLDRCQTVK